MLEMNIVNLSHAQFFFYLSTRRSSKVMSSHTERAENAGRVTELQKQAIELHCKKFWLCYFNMNSF